MTKTNLSAQNFNQEDFGRQSQDFYEKIKGRLEEKDFGKYAALDFETEKYWTGETATEALTKAKKAAPGRLFYLVQVGFPAAFRIPLI